MLGEGSDFWLELLVKYLITNPSVTIEGRPSKELMEKNKNDESQRIQLQRETLKEEGLKSKNTELMKAMENNDVSQRSQFPLFSMISSFFI